MKNIVIFIFAILWTCNATTLLAENNNVSRLWPAKVKEVSRVQNLVKVEYLLPCGSEFFSAAIRPAKKRKALEIAILITREDGRCSRLPQVKTKYFRSIKNSWPVFPSRLDRKFSTRLKFQTDRVLSHQVRVTKKKQFAEIAFVKHCRLPDFFLVREEGKRLELGLARLEIRNRGDNRCRKQSVVSSQVRFLKPNQMSEFGLISEYDSQESLALKPVLSLDRSQRGMLLHARFRKSCNEAPIGIVVGNNPKEQMMGTFRLAVLTARVSDYDCTKRERVATYSLQNIALNNLKRIKQLKSQDQTRSVLRLIPPEKSDRVKKSRHEIRVIKGCEKTVGVVYANDRFRKVATASLIKKSPGRACRASFSSKVIQNRVSIAPRTKQIYPLSLKPRSASSSRFSGLRKS